MVLQLQKRLVSCASIILHIPHTSTAIPPKIRSSFLIGDEELKEELLRMTDWYTDELFGSSIQAMRIVFPVSRLVVDPERFIDDSEEPMAIRGMGAIYTRTSQGNPLRSTLSESGRKALLIRYYEPHHRALEQAADRMLDQYQRCLIIDCHSFSSIPLTHEPDQNPDRPQVCIGIDEYHTPSWLVEAAQQAFDKQGFKTEINRPFSGSLVPLKFYHKNSKVLSIMVELNRSLYMDERTGVKNAAFDSIRSTVTLVIESLSSKVDRSGA